jgi:hypothetical protein
MHVDPIVQAAHIGSDLPWDIAYENALNFNHQSASSFSEPVSQTAYAGGEIPLSYIVCEKDAALTAASQRAFVKKLEAGSGRAVSVVSLESGHCPHWSMPEKLAEVIVREVGKE